jgi:hypothetical protein
MSIKISPKAEEVKNLIWELMELSNIDICYKVEAFCALAIELRISTPIPI